MVDLAQGVLDRRTYAAGTEIFRAGTSGSTAYLLLAGDVEIRAPGKDGAVLAKVKVGQVFGELALLNQETRTATAYAVTLCEVAVISAGTLKRKLAQAD